MDRICNACGKSFTIPKQRGRPALKCESCRGAKPKCDHDGVPEAQCVRCQSKPNAAVVALMADPGILKDPVRLRALADLLYLKDKAEPPTKPEATPSAPQKPIVRKGRVFAPVAEIPKPEPIVAPIPVGSRVRVKAREWRGIHRPEVSGRLVAWERDSKGIYAVVESQEGRVLARPENVKAA